MKLTVRPRPSATVLFNFLFFLACLSRCQRGAAAASFGPEGEIRLKRGAAMARLRQVPPLRSARASELNAAAALRMEFANQARYGMSASARCERERDAGCVMQGT